MINHNSNFITTNFTDNQGIKSTLIIESLSSNNITLPRANYKLVTNLKTNSNNYLKIKKPNLFTTDIGLHTKEFLPVLTLSTIMACSIILILFNLLKY